METLIHEWREIPGFENYAVSSYGEIKRLRSSKWARTKPGQFLTVLSHNHGYSCVSLTRDKKAFKLLIHRLVLLAFIGECPPRWEVNHLDGNKKNNRFNNLEYCTSSENKIHSEIIGIGVSGERNGSAKLTRDDVFEIRQLSLDGHPYPRIARRYEVSVSHIKDIVLRRRWGWL